MSDEIRETAVPAADPAPSTQALPTDSTAAAVVPAQPAPLWTGKVMGEDYAIKDEAERDAHLRDALLYRRQHPEWGRKEREYRDKLEEHNRYRRDNDPIVQFFGEKYADLEFLFPDRANLRPEVAELVARLRGGNGPTAANPDDEINLDELDETSRPLVQKMLNRIERSERAAREIQDRAKKDAEAKVAASNQAVEIAQSSSLKKFMAKHTDLTEGEMREIADELVFLGEHGVRAETEEKFDRILNNCFRAARGNLTTQRVEELRTTAAADALDATERQKAEDRKVARLAPDTGAGGGPRPDTEKKDYGTGLGATTARIRDVMRQHGVG